jgi:protein-S-isoprenylcysteine O-methyltransferase Ste14
MKRWTFFAFAVAAYLGFLGIYAYLCGFTGNFLVPKSIDAPSTTPMAAAIVINVALMLFFGLQHSIMARPAFKKVWTRIVPKPIERAVYNVAAVLALALMVWQWRGIDVVVWNVQNPVGRNVLWTLFAAGWLMVPAVSLMISHFDLFGLRQAWIYARGQEYAALPFRTPYLYAHIRHPLYVGWALAFWATPTMTVGHLVYAFVLTGYMAAAALVEERDLIAHFGRQYLDYCKQVPRYIPRFKRSESTTTAPSQSTIETLTDTLADSVC